MVKVVYEFHIKKSSASSSLTRIRKHFPKAIIEQDLDGRFLVVVKNCESREEADKLVHELYAKGYWGGIYTPEGD